MTVWVGVFLCLVGPFIQDGTFIASMSDGAVPENQHENRPESLFPPALVARGESLYQRRCGACHALDRNRVGPAHRGVYGRAAGAVPGFRYSKALQALDIVWNNETLDLWLQNPTSFAPGTGMGFRLGKADERNAIIIYLQSLSAP